MFFICKDNIIVIIRVLYGRIFWGGTLVTRGYASLTPG